MRKAGGKRYWSLERDPVFGAVIQSLVSLAGLSDVIKVLQRGEGKTVKMFVKRTNGLIYTEFKLKRMI